LNKKVKEIHDKILKKIGDINDWDVSLLGVPDTIFGISIGLDSADDTLIIYDKNEMPIDSSHKRYGEVIEAIWNYIKDKDPIDEFLKSIAV